MKQKRAREEENTYIYIYIYIFLEVPTNFYVGALLTRIKFEFVSTCRHRRTRQDCSDKAQRGRQILELLSASTALQEASDKQ